MQSHYFLFIIFFSLIHFHTADLEQPYHGNDSYITQFGTDALLLGEPTESNTQQNNKNVEYPPNEDEDNSYNSTSSSSSGLTDDSSTEESEDAGENFSVEFVEESKATAATSNKSKQVTKSDQIVTEDSSTSEDSSSSEDCTTESNSIEMIEKNIGCTKTEDRYSKLVSSKIKVNDTKQLDVQAKSTKQGMNIEQFIPLRLSPRKKEYICVEDDHDSLTTEEDSRDPLTTEASSGSDGDLTAMAKEAGLGESSESSSSESDDCMELFREDCDEKVTIYNFLLSNVS